MNDAGGKIDNYAKNNLYGLGTIIYIINIKKLQYNIDNINFN